MTDEIRIPIIFVTKKPPAKEKEKSEQVKQSRKTKKEIKKKSHKTKKKDVTPSKAPAKSPEKKNWGGIYGGKDDKAINFNKKARQISGGVEVERDRHTKSPAPQERWIHQIKRLENQIDQNKTGIEKTVQNLQKQISKVNDVADKLSGLASNPPAFFGKQMVSILRGAGPYAAVIVAAISFIASSPEAIEKTIKAFSVKGAPLNKDFRVAVEEIVTGFLSLNSQQRRDLGLDSFINAQTSGYTSIAGTSSYNSLLNRDELRLNMVNQDEK